MASKPLWKATQLNGCESPHANGSRTSRESTPAREDENGLTARKENPDNLFEIVPKLLIDRPDLGDYQNSINGDGAALVEKNKLSSKIFLATTTVGSSGGNITNLNTSSNELVGIAFDRIFLVLSKDMATVEKSIEFDAPIDFLLWRKSVLLLGLASSEVILLHPITFEKTASRKVCPSTSTAMDGNGKYSQPFFSNAFIHPTSNPTTIDLITISTNGDIYSFPNVSLAEDLLDFTQDESMMSINIDVGTIKGTIQRSCLKEGAKVIAACSPSATTMITAEELGTVSYFSIESNPPEEASPSYLYRQLLLRSYNRSADVLENLDLKGQHSIVKLIQCQSALFILFSNGQLHYVVDDMLLLTERVALRPPSYIIHDCTFVIRQSGSIKLWIIYSDEEDGDHHIAIYPAPHFRQPEFTMKIPSSSDNSTFRFPTQSSSYDEPNAFIEILSNGSTKVYHMSEVSTDISLQKLLDKGRFHKAELLALKYSKNLDIVWKAKVEALAIELGHLCQQQHKNCQKVFDELLLTLGKIQEADWICGFIVKGRIVPKLEWVKDLLSLGLKRVAQCSGSESGQKLLLTRKKFYTFEQVLPGAGVKEWNSFNSEKNTMFGQCVWFLENNEFQKCEIVWMRHSDEFITSIEIADLAKFFRVLFEAQLKTGEAVSLFKTILPFAIEKCEENGEHDKNLVAAKINALITLVRSQLRSLEREKQWPAEAIAFTTILKSVVEEQLASVKGENENFGGSEPSQASRAERKLFICNEILGKLKYLLQALTELSHLRSNHSIRIPFEKYTSDDITEVVNSMLHDLLARDELDLFVTQFLRPFASRNGLDMDHLFKEHVKAALEELPYYENASAIPFEERLITLVSYMSSIRKKLECVLIMTEHWPVPWAPSMDELVKGAINGNLAKFGADGECAELQERIKWLRVQVPYRCLQRKYRLVPHRLATGFGVQMALLRILTWKKPDYYEDCLELIKHTGKYTESDVRVFRFWVELSKSELPLEEVVPDDLKDVDLLRNMLERLLIEFRQGEHACYEEKHWTRFTDCAHLIANRINDTKTLEFLKLRPLIPNLTDPDIIESPSYPFSALELLLQTAHSKTSEEIIRDCNQLSIITFTGCKNLLVVAAAFFILPGPGSAFQKLWDLVERVVREDGLLEEGGEGDLVSKAGLSVAHEMTLHIPSLTTRQLETLHEFCRLLANSFAGATTEPVAKLFGILRIFETLREQEIPLENEFLCIYRDVWLEGLQKVSTLFKELTKLGEAVLRFGNRSLHSQIFNAVKLELNSQVRKSFAAGRKILMDTANQVSELKQELLSRAESLVEAETNPRIVNLVKSLEEAGLPMNSYALLQRNKGKLISKLLELGLFHLAAQTALVFDYKDAQSWSNILKQFMLNGSVADLKTVLESLKKIADLWVLPEFSQAWLKVAEVQPMFRHMCPIPLE